MNGQTQVIRLLLDHGADVNAIAVSGTSPLHLATDGETARILIAAGADLDLGRVAAPAAAEALLALAAEARDDGGKLVMGAVVADSATVWPALLHLARAPSVSEDTRDNATLWLGFAAGDALGPDDYADEDDVRESAIFVLSQRPKSESIPALTRVVEGDLPIHLKKSALFWLGQTDRERAVAWYEEILRGS